MSSPHYSPRRKTVIARCALWLSPLWLLCAMPAQAGPYAEREDVRQFAREIAARNELDAGEVEARLAAVQPIPKVIELIRPPADPGVRSWQRYRSRFIEPLRIRAGLQFWQTHQTTLARAEAEFAVPQEIIVSIIGVETIYGRNTGNFSTLGALATLAFDYPPRAELFRRELEALFALARDEGVPPESFQGSYAGALGLPQFLPSSVRNYAVDFDGDGHINLLKNPVDAIGSVGNFLARHGWAAGGLIAQRAQLKPDIDPAPLLATGLLPQYDEPALEAAGVTSLVSNAAPAALIDLVTPGQATEYWLGYQNFYVITRYNRSSFYAMSVRDLAIALRSARDAATNSSPARKPDSSAQGKQR